MMVWSTHSLATTATRGRPLSGDHDASLLCGGPRTTMAQNKKQHYLGQAYLKGFADRERRDAIWQFRASTSEVRLKGISNVGQRSYFYSTEDPSGNRDHSIERWFSRVESWWPSLLEKISSNLESISTGNRALRITDDDRVRILHAVYAHSSASRPQVHGMDETLCGRAPSTKECPHGPRST